MSHNGTSQPVAEAGAPVTQFNLPASARGVAPASQPPQASPSNAFEVMAQLSAAPNLKGKNAEMRSALNTLAKVLDRPLRAVPADPARLRPLMASARPVLAGVTKQRWTQVRSNIVAALTSVGIEVMPGRATAGLSAAWKALHNCLPDRAARAALTRICSHFSRKGVNPAEVAEGDLEGFKQALLTQSLHETAEAAFRATARAWNTAGKTVAGWPSVTFPIQPDPRRYGLPREHVPAAFWSDVEAFLRQSGQPNPLRDDWCKPVAPSTLETRTKLIRQIASALVASGYPAEGLTSLAVLVAPANAEAALDYLLARNAGESKPQIHNQAQVLLTISRHWVKASLDAQAPLRMFVKNLSTPQEGMAVKNSARLRQFDVEANVRAFVTLPPRVLKDVQQAAPPDRNDAVRVMNALAVEILLMAPVRLKNLTGIELGRQLQEIRRGPERKVHLVFPAEEVKNRQAFSAVLPAESAALLHAYVTRYRPLIFPGESPYLFPGRDGGLRASGGFSSSIYRFIERETGLEFNVHLFRHLASKLWLNDHPGDLETVRQLLNHASMETTVRAYTELLTAPAVRRYDKLIADLRAQAGPHHPPARNGR